MIRFLGWDTAFSCIHALLVGAKLLVYISSLVGRQTIKGGLHGIPFMLVSAKASQVTFPLIVSGRRRSDLVRRMFMLVWSREFWLGRILRPS